MQRETGSGLVVVEDHRPRPPGATVEPSFASRPVDITDDRQRRLATEGSTTWQKEAWTYFDEVEEVKFAATFRGALMSRLLLFAGFINDRDQPPIPATEAPPGTLPAEIAAAAVAELERLGTLDQQAGLFASWGSIATVSGESYLVGQEDDLADSGEKWRLFSESNLVRDFAGVGVAVRTRPGAPTEPLGPDDAKIRVWRPHARWPDLADSNMRSVLATAEELLIYARQMRAVGKSRNSNGILYLPNEIGDPPQPDGKPTAFEQRFMESQAKAITEDGAPAAAMRFLIRGPAAFGTGQRQIPAKEAVFTVDLDRKIDEKAIERIEFLVKRLAHGLDVPVEILTGIADINHWGAWQIEDSTYKAHIEPDALTFATAITTELIRPGLLDTFGRAALPWIRRVVVGVNPAALVVRPNRGQDAKDAFDRFAISWDALRHHLNFGDGDAPDDDELERRLAIPADTNGVVTQQELPAADGDQPIPDDTQPEPEAPPEQAAAVAAPTQLALPVVGDPTSSDVPRGTQNTTPAPPARFATSQQAAGLGERLAATDRSLTDRLVTAASDSLTSALRIIGNRLRSAAQGNPDMLTAIDGVDAPLVGAALIAAGFTLPDIGQMVDDSTWFDQLHGRYDSWTAAAFQETTRTLTSVTADEDRPTVEAEVTADQDDRTSAGWALLYGAMRTLAVERTADPTPPAARGEIDGLSAVPQGHVRSALEVTGGTVNPGSQPMGLAGEISASSNSGGIATGPQTARALRIAGFSVSGWTWHTGAPIEPFAPHHDLAGVAFTSWDDDILINGLSWPSFSHFFPGDHAGCQCSTTPTLVPITEG